MGVIIKAVVDGFRRCGIAHRAKGTYYPDGYFTEEQLAQLRAEPQLLITDQGDPGQSLEDDDLIDEMGNAIAALEHELEQSRAGLKVASADVVRILALHAGLPAAVVQDASLLVSADPTAEGVICITADDLVAIISQNLTPTSPEAHSNGSKSVLDAASDELAQGAPTDQADAAQADPDAAALTGKAAGKRNGAKKDAQG